MSEPAHTLPEDRVFLLDEGAPPTLGVSLVIPAYNEEPVIETVVTDAKTVLEGLKIPYEIIVVDDMSTDATARLAESAGVTVLRNPQNGGYGYSLMRGIRHASHPTIAIIDADGSYPIDEIPRLLREYRRGIAMVVGERQGPHYFSSWRLKVLRFLFRTLTEFIVGRSVPDVNSGMRIFERQTVIPLLPYMSYGFSFTTSITLFFMMRAKTVSYVPVTFLKRVGPSKVHYFRDSLRALQIVASITVRLNPIKLFLVAAMVNVIAMLPVLVALSRWGDIWTGLVITLETSIALGAVGLGIEAFVDRSRYDGAATQKDQPRS